MLFTSPQMLAHIGIPDAVITYINHYTDAASSPYTFTDKPIGTAAANRTVVVGVVAYIDGGGVVSGVTIGGITATEKAVAHGGGADASIWEADVPAGTTATIVVTMTGTPHRCDIGLWVLRGVGAADDTATDLTNPLSQSLTVSDGGVALAVSTDNAGSISCSWGGDFTERYDVLVEPNTYASGADASGGGTKTVSATWTGSGDPALVAVAWPKG